MSRGENENSPGRCRERRQRRIQKRRNKCGTNTATRNGQPNLADGSSTAAFMSDPSSLSPSSGDEPMLTEAVSTAPAFGAISIAGMMFHPLEDTVSIRPNLCRSEINGGKPLHFFAVFDGHGGSHVSTLCRDRMHALLEEELARVSVFLRGSCSSGELSERVLKIAWRQVMKNCFLRMDVIATSKSVCGSSGQGCLCPADAAKYAGSTAVMAVLTDHHFVIANCGDSRAVLCLGGISVPLSSDHKPDRPDERARIEALGGRVVYADVPRVEGVLAMSRAIGDVHLKPIVTAEPEVSLTRRGPDDEFLILASDGLWDVLSSHTACKAARVCHREAYPPRNSIFNPSAAAGDHEEASTSFFASQSAAAAELLTRFALARRSSDNISVIVVDLKRNQACTG